MKKILIIALIALAGCGVSRYGDDDNSSSDSCTIYHRQDADGVVIECPDSTEVTILWDAIKQEGHETTTVQSSSNSLTRYLYCDSTLSNTNLSVYYRLATFSSGYTQVFAGVYGTQIEVNNSLIYPFSHEDHQMSPVYFTYDLAGEANGGYWRIYYNTETRNVTVDYIDIDDSFTWELTECVVENY